MNAGAADLTSCRYGSRHEAVQPLGEHESHNDSVYFNFAGPPGCGVFGGVVRVGLRPNEGYSEASLMLPLVGGGVLFHYARTPLAPGDVTAGSPAWESGPMSLRAVDPTRRWSLSYAGEEARLLTDSPGFGQQPGLAWRASRRMSCKLDLRFEAEFPLHVLSPGGDLMPGRRRPAYGRDHYEQFGRLTGALRIGDEHWQIEAAPAFRDHSWGPRVWESAPDQDFVVVYLDDGRRVAAVANRRGAREDVHGVGWAPGDTEPAPLESYAIRSSYDGGPVLEGPVGWTFVAAGQTIDVEGEVDGYLPLRVGSGQVRIAQALLRLGPGNPGSAKTDLTRPLAAGAKPD